MKFIEVNTLGGEHKHLISLNKIIDFDFSNVHTTITFTNGKEIKVIESESTIKEMLSYHNVNWVNEENIHTFYEGLAEYQLSQEFPFEEDKLPF